MKDRNGSTLIRLLVILGSIAAILTAAALLYSRYNNKKRSSGLSIDFDDCFDDDCDDCGCCCDGSCFSVEDGEADFDLGEEDDEEPEDILSF